MISWILAFLAALGLVSSTPNTSLKSGSRTNLSQEPPSKPIPSPLCSGTDGKPPPPTCP
jgi:hypothetical protein